MNENDRPKPFDFFLSGFIVGMGITGIIIFTLIILFTSNEIDTVKTGEIEYDGYYSGDSEVSMMCMMDSVWFFNYSTSKFLGTCDCDTWTTTYKYFIDSLTVEHNKKLKPKFSI